VIGNSDAVEKLGVVEKYDGKMQRSGETGCGNKDKWETRCSGDLVQQ
jgi:hypothetical protein